MPRFPVDADASISRLEGGLINHTFLVANGGGPRFVLQRVNPLFPVEIHENIVAVTGALERANLTTPVLVRTRDGATCLQLSPQAADAANVVWRLMTYVEGTSVDVVTGPAQAHAAGRLVARFHGALAGLSHRFVGLRASVHDTKRHLDHMQHSARTETQHRLSAAVVALADAISEGAGRLPALPALPAVVCHGDLKINNFLFAGTRAPGRDEAVCLIDLDTVGPMPLAFELGDAWRSWCNRSGEDQEQAALDLTLFEASLDGYREGLGRALTAEERRALLLGPEWISLELAARFAADALGESYFGWDGTRFAGRGEHNLVRARGQLSLHQAFEETRPQRARLLGAR